MLVLVKIITSPYLLWFLLAIPSTPYLLDFIFVEEYYSEMMHRTGVISTQLLVFTLSISPMLIIIKRLSFTKLLRGWLLKSRRHFGVASFAYALLHLLLYVRDVYYIEDMFDELLTWRIGSGWVAFFFFVPLALTSNNLSMKILAKKWKPLQRLVYIAAIFTFVHWLTLNLFYDLGVQWLVLLIVAKLVHVCLYWYSRVPTFKMASKKAAT